MSLRSEGVHNRIILSYKFQSIDYISNPTGWLKQQINKLFQQIDWLKQSQRPSTY